MKKKVSKRFEWNILELTLIIWGIFVFFTFVIPVSFIPYDNYALSNFSSELLSVATPKETVVLERSKDFGSLNGNGDHCDFYAAILVATDLSQKELADFYQQVYRGKSEVDIFKVDSFKEMTFGPPHPIVVERYAEKIYSRSLADISNLYIVYIYEAEFVSGIGDIRCG